MAGLNFLWLSVIIHCAMGACSFYAFTVVANMEPFLKNLTIKSLNLHYNLTLSNDQWYWGWSIINSSLYVGCLFGSLIISPTIKMFRSRDSVMLIKNIILMLSSTLPFASVPLNCIELLVVGRFLSGIAHELGIFTPVFISECCPVSIRGQASNATHIGFRIWTVLGAIVALPQLLGTQYYWHFCFLIPIIPSFLHLLCTYFVPESAKVLYANEQRRACELAVKRYHGKACDVSQVLEQYASELSLAKKRVSLCEILASRHLVWPLSLCVLSIASMPLSGLMVVYSYSTSLITSIGVNQENAALLTAFVIHGPGFVMAVLSTLLVERCGRKILYLAGLCMVLLGQICVLLSDFVPFHSYCSSAGLLLVLSGASLSFVIVLTLPGELCPVAIRPIAFGYSSVVGFGLSLTTVFTFPPLEVWIGTYAIIPFLVATLFMFGMFLVFLPETKAKTVEQVLEKWRPNGNTM